MHAQASRMRLSNNFCTRPSISMQPWPPLSHMEIILNCCADQPVRSYSQQRNQLIGFGGDNRRIWVARVNHNREHVIVLSLYTLSRLFSSSVTLSMNIIIVTPELGNRGYISVQNIAVITYWLGLVQRKQVYYLKFIEYKYQKITK